MLQRVDVGPRPIEQYQPIIGRQAVRELHALAGRLRGRRLAHINATSYGGGVSELLRSLVPLYRAIGIEADWLVIPGSSQFFDVTKRLHNGLQGAHDGLTDDEKAIYLSHSQQIADAVPDAYDYIVVHDPQPAAVRTLRGADHARWVWRCHIDTSNPDAGALDFLKPFLIDYDARVFTMDQFVPPSLRSLSSAIIPPGIDPLSPKNMSTPNDLSRQIVAWSGLRLDQPLITQVSRFDPWKDPLGVIRVFRRVQQQLPEAQLALLGQMALDDPEGWEMYRAIAEETADDAQIHVLTNFTGIGNIEVNAFQSCSDVVVQKSIREGFGLVVSETLWKGTAMVAGRAGGIPMQMPDGVGGFLVEHDDDYVEHVVRLLRNPREAAELGATGRAHVRKHFLITRLLADELRLLSSLD